VRFASIARCPCVEPALTNQVSEARELFRHARTTEVYLTDGTLELHDARGLGYPVLIEDRRRRHRQTRSEVLKALHVVTDHRQVLSMEVWVQTIPVRVKTFNKGQNAFPLMVDCPATKAQRTFPLP
jgi:hypothetical protein